MIGLIFNYIKKKLAEEYHNLNLWYFVFFFYGITFYFKSINSLIKYQIFEKIFAFTIILAIMIFVFILIIRKFEQLILSFFFSLLLSFIIGISVASFRLNNIDSSPINKNIIFNIEARISKIKPTIKGYELLLVDINPIEKIKLTKSLNKIKVSIRAKDSPVFAVDDLIKTRVKLFPITSSSIPGAYDFGIFSYLQSIDATGYIIGSPEIIKQNNHNKLSYTQKQIANIRNNIYQRLINILSKYEGNFMAAILIGETKAIDNNMTENMRNSGISHILSVSGLHLSLVAMIFFVTSRFLLNCSNYLSYKINIKIIAGIFSIFGSFCYLLLSGSKIAATRAFIMTTIVILAIIFERTPHALRSVMVAAFVILFFWPEYVMHPSFQLSFSAVLCLISGYELYIKNQQIFGKAKGLFGNIKLYLFTNIYSSFLASIVTAPFVIYYFYKFSIYSILMNLLAVPLMSFFVMPLTIISLILMMFGLDKWPLILLSYFIKIIDSSAAYISAMPNAVINTGHITESSMLVFTFGFFWICLWQTIWRYFGLVIMVISVIMMVFFSANPIITYDHNLHIIAIQNGSYLNIYSNNKISDFTKNHLLGWHGITYNRIFYDMDGFDDRIFDIPLGSRTVTVSLNYKNCYDAEIQIITSKHLKCSNGKLVIPYAQLIKSGVVSIFSNQDKDFYANFGHQLKL